MHISESYFLKIFPHRRRGMPPPTLSPFSAGMRARPRFTRIMRPPTFKVAPNPMTLYLIEVGLRPSHQYNISKHQ